MRKELCAIRDKVNVLIDAIDRVPKTFSDSVLGRVERRVISDSSVASATQLAQAPPGGVKGEGIV